MQTTRTEVLIVGAGPTGLVLATGLSRFGVRFRIVDRVTEPGTTSRALVVQARTLELYRAMGLADEVVARGVQVEAVNLWARRRKVVRLPFGELGVAYSRFPYALVYPQDEHERMLIDRLAERGVEIERGVELLGFEERDDAVHARLRDGAGREETCVARYLAGCDGARSTVRETAGLAFPGGTYQHVFYVADVVAHGPAMNGELHVELDDADFLALFPMKGEGRARFVGNLPDEIVARAEHAGWDDVRERVSRSFGMDVDGVNWFSTYRVHHRVVDRFREGRVFVLGDAAHIHSPVGGQGMNTGIGDAVNLAWKLAAVVRGRMHDHVLASYERERRPFALRLVATTDRAFEIVTRRGRFAAWVRLKLVPRVLSWLFRLAAFRRYLFRNVSQIRIDYRASDFNEGRVGRLRGGDRLPWVEAIDNHAPLSSLDWQAHVYGEPSRSLVELCRARGLALHVFAWSDDAQRAGLRRGATYVVRPDGYLGWIGRRRATRALGRWLDARGIAPRDRSRAVVPAAEMPSFASLAAPAAFISPEARRP